MIPFRLTEKWSEKYKRSIDCKNPKGFSQRAHCQGKLNEDQAVLQLSQGKMTYTGPDAERHMIQTTGGRYSEAGAGSHRTDAIGSHPEYGDLNVEVKTGNHDQQQVRTEVHPDGTHVRQTAASQRKKDIGDQPELARLITRGSEHEARLAGGKLSVGTVTREGETRKRPAATEEGEIKDRRISLSHRNMMPFLTHEDPIQIHVSQRTGEAVIVPMRKHHHHHALRMGVPRGKVVSFESLATSRKHGNKKSPFHARGGRRKGSTINYSVGGDSHQVVESIRDAGGHVFKSLTHLGKHLKAMGWTFNSGHQN